MSVHTVAYRNVLKSEKLGAIRVDLVVATDLNDCGMCGYRSTPKKVHHRTTACRLDESFAMSVLCMGCWNKRRPLLKAMAESEANAYLIRKITKEIRHG